jgi:type IV fimbrial biogenesis protein FimT
MVQTLKNKKGFTLIELLSVILITAIMLALGLPAFLEAINNQRLKGTARDLYSIFQKAKIEAIRRNSNVAVSITPAAYSPDGMKGSYQVFVDNGAGGGTAENFTRDGTEEIIATASMPRKISLISASFTGGTKVTAFNSRGLPVNSRIGNVQLRNTIRWYKLSLSIAGNVKMEISKDGVNWN